MLDVLLPVFALVATGWALGRFGGVPPRPLAQTAFWVLSPALIFESLRTAELSLATTVVAFALLHHGAMLLLALGAARVLFPDDAGARAAVGLVATFGNVGNLGLPVLLFAYGPEAVDVGAVYLATNTLLLATVGIAVAGWDGGWAGWRRAVGSFLRVPWPYAVALAFLVRWTGYPALLARATGLLAAGAIPLFLLVLGLELASVRIAHVAAPAVGLAVLRLGAGGALGWALAALLRAEGLLRGSLILEASMPTAVNAFLVASQFERRPDLAASVLFLSTLFSLGTLSLTLHLLGVPG